MGITDGLIVGHSVEELVGSTDGTCDNNRFAIMNNTKNRTQKANTIYKIILNY